MSDTLTDGLAELAAHRTSALCSPALATEMLTAAFDVGAAVPVTDLLVGGEACLPLWSELCAALVPLGWHSEVGWDESSPRLILLPPGKTTADYDGLRCWWLTVEAYGDGTIDIHGGRPVLPEADFSRAAFANFPSFSTVKDALEALDG